MSRKRWRAEEIINDLVVVTEWHRNCNDWHTKIKKPKYGSELEVIWIAFGSTEVEAQCNHGAAIEVAKEEGK